MKIVRKNWIKILSLIFIISMFSDCRKKEKTKRITYSFSVDAGREFIVFIAYKDSDGYKTLYTDREWTEEVCLNSGGVASLLIIPQTEVKMNYTGKIISNENIKTNTGRDVVSLSILIDSL